MPILPEGQSTGQALGDLFGGVNRPQLNAFVAQSQAKNGLVSAQTQDALLKASQAQEQLDAHGRIVDEMMRANPNMRLSQAQLARDFWVGSHNDDPVTALKALGTSMLMFGTPEQQTAGQQGVQGKVAEPVALPNNFTTLPGTAPVVPQQSPQGAAQTAQTKAVTSEDIARAEEAHAKAKNALTGGLSVLSPDTVEMAARVVMADPTKMSSYAGFGAAGQANKNAVNNRQAALLTAAGMTPDDMIRQRAITKASVGAAGQAAKQQQVLDAFMPLVKNNSDRIIQLLDSIDAAGSAGVDEPIVNGFERMLGRKLNNDDLAELHSVFTTYQAEIARLLAAGPSLNGVISDHARGEVENMAPESMSASQARRVLNRVDLETSIRRQGVHQSLLEAAGAQLPVISQPQPGNGPAAAGAGDEGLPPGFHRLN